MSVVLLVIDGQKIYTDPNSEMYCPDSRATIERINRLIKRFEDSGNPIIYIRHIHKQDGTDLGRMFDYLGEAEEDFNFKKGTPEVEYDDGLSRSANAQELVKTRYSAFVGTRLAELLKEVGAERVVICGFMTNFCCESTGRNAHDLDYYVDFVIDATGTPGTDNLDEEKIRSVVGEFMEHGFARVMTTEDFLTQ